MIPKDPFMLLSYVNMKLRDEYASFEELCRSEDLGPDAVLQKLNDVGFVYDTEKNTFR